MEDYTDLGHDARPHPMPGMVEARGVRASTDETSAWRHSSARSMTSFRRQRRRTPDRRRQAYDDLGAVMSEIVAATGEV
jgi:hypothetical protein